ncbi:hypothetical protein HY68_04150 [Streptomyces sp. AcH 505]|uniref:ATP-binding protein n=1 Tax=Streptomyces sp. AcH 505 TaxID=352211 RepID=UPI000591D6D9|nr:hypothetical protein HY68_04150 [Streptomyces sp. AcH 505]
MTETATIKASALDGLPPLVVKRWPSSAQSVGRARHLLLRHLQAWRLTDLADSAPLVLSELVTNAVQHGRVPGRLIETRFERLVGGVRIEVHDAGDTKPQLRTPTADDDSGRGLALVDALTNGCWGVSGRAGVGKLVWAVCADDSAKPGS